MDYQIGVADYGMDVWYGGNLNLARRLELLKGCGIDGIEWLKGADSYISPGDYIPQPGDWVFLTFTGGVDTDHVAMVEYCSRDPESGAVRIHVIEGNAPVAVARNTYSLLDGRILGYGTVHDVADITMHFGNRGEKVRQLQEKLVYLGLLQLQ